MKCAGFRDGRAAQRIGTLLTSRVCRVMPNAGRHCSQRWRVVKSPTLFPVGRRRRPADGSQKRHDTYLERASLPPQSKARNKQRASEAAWFDRSLRWPPKLRPADDMSKPKYYVPICTEVWCFRPGQGRGDGMPSSLASYEACRPVIGDQQSGRRRQRSDRPDDRHLCRFAFGL